MLTAAPTLKAQRIAPPDLPLAGVPVIVAPPDPDRDRLAEIDARLAEIGSIGPGGTQAEARALNEKWIAVRTERDRVTREAERAERSAYHAWKQASDKAARNEAEAARLTAERKGVAARARNREQAMEAAAA